MNPNIWELGDLGEAWHGIWSGHSGGGAVSKWHARLPPDPANLRYYVSYYVTNGV